MDRVITRLDSVVEAIQSVREYYHLQWADEVLNLLWQAINGLDLDIFPSISRAAGRPKILVPTHAIENLLAMNFTVEKIACMLGISRDTVFRRMRENGLSVSTLAVQHTWRHVILIRCCRFEELILT
jgi:transcriptional regulator of acetoin/glycerol metabolism